MAVQVGPNLVEIFTCSFFFFQYVNMSLLTYLALHMWNSGYSPCTRLYKGTSIHHPQPCDIPGLVLRYHSLHVNKCRLSLLKIKHTILTTTITICCSDFSIQLMHFPSELPMPIIFLFENQNINCGYAFSYLECDEYFGTKIIWVC